MRLKRAQDDRYTTPPPPRSPPPRVCVVATPLTPNGYNFYFNTTETARKIPIHEIESKRQRDKWIDLMAVLVSRYSQWEVTLHAWELRKGRRDSSFLLSHFLGSMLEYTTPKIQFEFTLEGELEAWGRHITWTNRGGAKRNTPPLPLTPVVVTGQSLHHITR